MAADKFLITNWCGVPHCFIRHEDGSLAVDRLEQVKRAGLNLLAVYDHGYETNCEVLAACEKLGLKVSLIEDRIRHAIGHPENRRELVEAVVRDYSQYPALFEYHLTDEPNSGAFPSLGAVTRLIEELDPAHEAYINLFPNYATPEMLGNPTYYDHLDEYMQVVNPPILSYDHYNFHKGEPIEDHVIEDDRERGIYEVAYRKIESPGFFNNIEDAYAITKKYNKPLMIIVLVTEHGPYRNLTEAEIRWEVFNTLCYGIKRLCYFTYWTPGADHDEGDAIWHWKNAMITRDGHETAHYEQIARINKELSAVGNILLPYKVKEVYHLGREHDDKIRYWPGAYGDITEMNSDRALVGLYEQGYVMIANKNFNDPTVLTFSTVPGKRVMLYDKVSGIWSKMEAVDGVYTINLAAGDGELIKID
ncbi:MAG: hypothetical protein IIX90_01655 [Clostridia bacterium]|nr:hypothetical protein [Clostridia bacterium]